MDDGDVSAVERAFEDYLGSLAERAEALRDEARTTLERGARQAHDLGWSQRRIAGALGRSQPEVKRLLHRALESDPDVANVGVRPACQSVLDDVLRRRRDDIVAAASRHGVRHVRVFGSVAAGTADAGSDVDLLVDLDDGVGHFALGALEVELEQMLGRPVDIVPERSLRSAVRESIGAITL
ncbi:nucleotidyltransferase family protein [Isoptericola cucumis]|uniref:nucleotidyltransferase family protein n=1 Tax=Isoptericola cucumis TaxID=1776856 RepID=UPI001E5CCA88|nr:nucleotidyltransferase domain-containing protein [Isoptericola cucumis]